MINTVLGPIEKEAIGFTLSHEHLRWEFINSWQMYFDQVYDDNTTELIFNILQPVLKELKAMGCSTIVEASPPRGGQNLKLMQMLSESTDIHIVPNTGMPFKRHVYTVHKDFNIEVLAKRWIRDFEKGLDVLNGVIIKPAQIKLLLGDVGQDPLDIIDRKILKAAVIASKKTKMPIHCHLLKSDAALQAIEVLTEETFDFSKFLWAHASNEENFEVMGKIYSRGGWLGFDQIRTGTHERYIKLMKEAIDRGFKDRLLLSMDYDFYEEVKNDTQDHLTSFFDFFTQAVEQGISREVLMEILTINPGKFLDIE